MGFCMYLLGESPMGILNEPPDRFYGSTFVTGLGLADLFYIIQVLGGLAAIVIILCALIVMVVVNYPKTVSQVKTKIVQACLVIALLASLPLLFTVVYSVIKSTIQGG